MTEPDRIAGCECDQAFEPRADFHRRGCPVKLAWTLSFALDKGRGGPLEEQVMWLNWLADIGYGVDFTRQPPPPCSPRALAYIYAERDGEGVDDWTVVLLDGNTASGWYGDGKDQA